MSERTATNAKAGKVETEPVNRVADQLNGDAPATKAKQSKKDLLVIEPLKQAIMTVPIIGSTPLKILRFSQKSRDQVQATQEAGDQAKTKRRKEPKNFEEGYENAKYRCTQILDGKKVTWLGLNASGIRNGCIETCRMAGYAMTKAKMSIFAVEDGFDDIDKTPLCRIFGDAEKCIDAVRNASGVIDLRPRAMWPDWRMSVRIRFDESQFSPSDIINLMIRVGQQNGLGEGRPNGTNGAGTGNGIFLVNVNECSLERLSQKPIVWQGDQVV
jgi:hypothetical protein